MSNYSKRITHWLSGRRRNQEEVPSTVNASETRGTDTTKASLVINNVRLAYADEEMAKKLWKVECRGEKVINVSPADEKNLPPRPNKHEIDAGGSIMLPSLCHSHIHLDKCYILDRCKCETGDFKEALEVTAQAKRNFRFNKDDLLLRGRRLIRESVECGVTSMRAHVEVDTYVEMACLEVALHLKEEFKLACHVQIAVFAQEPIFDTNVDVEAGPNYRLLQEASETAEVEVIGSAPYVEATIEQAKRNIALILELAGQRGKHADFHLDYNLDPTSEPLIYELITQAQGLRRFWLPPAVDGASSLPRKRITVGHATRLQLFTPAQWKELNSLIGDLPITFVGLPNSDMYMQGRADTDKPLGPPRSTLRVPYIARQYDIQMAMSVNNIENAFTPQGSVDPLGLCALGAAIFQSATPADIRILARAVTLTSKLAMGIEPPRGLCPEKGDLSDFVIVRGSESLAQAVLNPSHDRTTIRQSRVVAQRRTTTWMILKDPRGLPVIRPWYRRIKWL
ncbi:Metallo-dependent hydrolase [Hymenopellis radicata]|nr:Metallo-dependent hydrolase [Hymenopellis radicata]